MRARQAALANPRSQLEGKFRLPAIAGKVIDVEDHRRLTFTFTSIRGLESMGPTNEPDTGGMASG